MPQLETSSKEPSHTVLSRHETPLDSSLSGKMVMAYELCQPVPDGSAYISFKLLQTRLDGTSYVCNHELVHFATESAASSAFSHVEAGTESGWDEMGATKVESLVRKPPLNKHQVM